MRCLLQRNFIIQHFTVLLMIPALAAQRQNADVDVMADVTAAQLFSEVSLLKKVFGFLCGSLNCASSIQITQWKQYLLLVHLIPLLPHHILCKVHLHNTLYLCVDCI